MNLSYQRQVCLGVSFDLLQVCLLAAGTAGDMEGWERQEAPCSNKDNVMNTKPSPNFA
jgi:hypothetical protein